MTKTRWLGLIAAAALGMTAGSLVNGRLAYAEETGTKQCFYYPPHPPTCEQCGPQACYGSGWMCCDIVVQ